MMVQDGTYQINDQWMDKVTQVVDWTLDTGMYAIINIHWDNGWVNTFPENRDECMKRYTTMWTQICDNFKDYGDHLMFESQNEELGWESLWNKWGGTNGKAESYQLVNEINQKFVDIVRNSGGNNDERHLLISGYNTGIDVTCDSMFKMPNDPAGRCAVSVHYYTPSTFAILEEDADWGKCAYTWGTEQEFAELYSQMDMMKNTFIDKGIPVIVGEYGCPKKNKDPNSVQLFLKSVCEAAYERQLCPILWDITDVHYDRTTCKMVDQELMAAFREIAGSEPVTPRPTDPVQPTDPTNSNQTEAVVTPDPEYPNIWVVDVKNADKVTITLKMSANTGATGCVGYSAPGTEWEQEQWTLDADSSGKLVYEFDIPDGVNSIQFQVWWPEGAEFVSAVLTSGNSADDPVEPTTEPVAPPAGLPGDVNTDGDVDILDVITLNKSLLAGEKLSDQGVANADVDGDSVPSVADSLLILKYTIKLVEKLA